MSESTLRIRLFVSVPLAALAYVIGQAVSGMVLMATPMVPPRMTAPAPVWGVASAVILALGLAPIARQLRGRLIARCCVLAAFLYLVDTANTAIETIIFTKIGGQAYIATMGLLPAVLCVVTMAAVQPAGMGSPDPSDGLISTGLAWRLAVSWLAFPVAYFVFGVIVAPLVIEPYSAEDGMLVLPLLRTVIATQAIRSMLYLLPTLAVMERWTGSRFGLWLALGWAHWALVGLAGLVMPNEIIGPKLRFWHSLEIGADSFLYTGILILVLVSAEQFRAKPQRNTDE